ncbi:putative Tuliposide A-converting enzyme 2, chloroplastic [Cocos nucifera]|nr:putative Tuliposide A-converting enzyme 2, chloroplastic [Cocos nucifera]
MRIRGLVLIHPYFSGKEPVGMESRDPRVRERMESTWRFVCGWKKGLEDPLVDPLRGEGMKGLGCERVLVSVAERDFLRERGRAYYEGLKRSGWGGKVELVESEGEEHVFHLQNPTGEKALAEMERMISFLHQD